MNEFHFLRPHWLWALLALAPLVWWLTRQRLRSRSWAAVCDARLLPFLLNDGVGAAKPGRHTPGWIAVAAGLAIVALAGPSWERIPQPVFRDQSALVIALDLSRSMLAADLKPNRLTRAKHKIRDLLALRPAGQTALLVYAGEAFTVTPLTDDGDTLLAQLPGLDTELMPRQGSRADRALVLANQLLKQAGAARGTILLITDGISGERMAQSLEPLRRAGHRVSVLGIGSATGAPVTLPEGGFLQDAQGNIVLPKLDAADLQHWAQRGGGRYAQLRTDDADLRHLLAATRRGGHDQTQAMELETDQWIERGPWLLLLLVPFAALAFRRGVLLMLLLLVLPLPRPAQALSWQDLWLRPDQQGARALHEGDAARAAQRFQDPRWKAAAQYRAGDYASAATSLEGLDDAEAHYNRGNALARMDRYPEAMASYQRALELDPQHQDAAHNLQLLKPQQDEQQQQSSDPSEQSQDDAQDAQQEGSDSGEGEASDQNQSPQDPSAQDQSTPEPSQQEGAQAQQQAQSDQQTDARATPPQADAADESESKQTQHRDDLSDAQQSPDTMAQHDAHDPHDLQTEADPGDAAMEQWLRRIPDDPSGLLRRKFLYQYQQRPQREVPEQQPW